MIERITIDNFKSLRHVDLSLGRLNLFIGTNASGKSNFFDALRVLQGVGNGFTFHEILDGKPRSATATEWVAIRGQSAGAFFAGNSDDTVSFALSGRFDDGDKELWSYEIAFAAREGRLRQEKLFVGENIYDSTPLAPDLVDPAFQVRYYGGSRGRQPHLKFDKNRPVLNQMARGGNGKWSKGHSEAAERLARALANMERVDPSPVVLRGYSVAHEINRMGERGENFAALVHRICADAKTKTAFESWLKGLRPAEVDEVGTLSGAVGEPLFMIKEGGRVFPAPVLSDGTLRFAAITAAFFQPDMPGVLTIEEIENAVHASRIRLLVELLRSRSAEGDTQVMATTHSPIVLAWLKPEEYRTTFFCKRDEATGESKICPLPDIPRFTEIVAKQPISDLFAEGWMEAAL